MSDSEPDEILESERRDPRELRLIQMWDEFVRVSQGILDGTIPEEEQPSAARMREIREFLQKNEVTLDFVVERKNSGPTGKLSAFKAPFPGATGTGA